MELAEELEHPIQPVTPEATLQTDAADMGYGGTLSTKTLEAGEDGTWLSYCVWSWKDRNGHITLR